MAQQAMAIRRASRTTPNILVLCNGAWQDIKNTPWADCMKQPGFRAIIPYMREHHKPGQWHGRFFKLMVPEKKQPERKIIPPTPEAIKLAQAAVKRQKARMKTENNHRTI